MTVNSPIKKKGLLYRKLHREAENHYINNNKVTFEEQRLKQSKDLYIEDFNNAEYIINISEVRWENKNLTAGYNVKYLGEKLPGNDFFNDKVIFQPIQLPTLVASGLLKFCFKTEESPDYLLPIVLFFLAIISAILIHFGIEVYDIFPFLESYGKH